MCAVPVKRAFDFLVPFKIPFFYGAGRLSITKCICDSLSLLGFVGDGIGNKDNIYTLDGKSFKFSICFLGNRNSFRNRYSRFL